MEGIIHCRPGQKNLEDLQRIAAGSLEEFPLRLLPKFAPWFPFHLPTFILKPQKCPPFISVDLSSKVDKGPFDPAPAEPFTCYDPTPHLLEFKANTSRDDDEQKGPVGPDIIPCDKMGETVSKEKTYVRSWSVCTRRGGSKDSIPPPSPDLKLLLDRLKLHLFHRGRWTILPSACGGRSLEEVWDQLSRMIKHGVLPSCNATVPPDVREIWIFCDLRYCEHIGKLVRTEVKLSGNIHLFVHKHGVILSI